AGGESRIELCFARRVSHCADERALSGLLFVPGNRSGGGGREHSSRKTRGEISSRVRSAPIGGAGGARDAARVSFGNKSSRRERDPRDERDARDPSDAGDDESAGERSYGSENRNRTCDSAAAKIPAAATARSGRAIASSRTTALQNG